MSTQQMTRDEWLLSIHSRIEPVGECMEWQGPMNKTIPIVYTPGGFAWEGNVCGKQSLRPILHLLSTGARIEKGQLIRMKCMNHKCVHEDHFLYLDRKTQAKEQARRKEFSTPAFKRARMVYARSTAKLDAEKAQEIRESGLSSREEAKKHGVSSRTVVAIRAGRLWKTGLSNSSVFSWRPTGKVI